MSRFPANSSYVFAAYSPENAELHVEIQRIEKRPDGRIYIDDADFTPWHGEKWKAAGKYRTAAEVSAGLPGYNPFENFKGASMTDAVFHNVGWTGVQVILGHAMRHYNALLGFVAVSRSRLDQHTSTKGGLFKKTVTVTVNGYVKPEWYVATPVEMQTDGGMTAGICVSQSASGSATTTCDDPAHIAISGISITQWKGGNMPVDESQIYTWQQKKSSFTIIFFTLVLALLTWGMALALLGPSGVVMAGTVGSGLGAGSLAAIAGATYALASTTFGSGGSLTQAQAGMFGSTGNGVLTVNLSSLSAQSQGLAKAVHNSMVLPAQGYSITGMNKLYNGACPTNYSVAQCKAAGLDPGQIWRSDGYSEVNMTAEMRAQYTTCKQQGLTGTALMQCAAPNATAWH